MESFREIGNVIQNEISHTDFNEKLDSMENFNKPETSEKNDIDSRLDKMDVLSSGAEKTDSSIDSRLDGVNTNKPETKGMSSDTETEKVKEYKDDNGQVYRLGNDLLPNKTIEKDNLTYKTDSLSRIKDAEGKLQVKNHEGRSYMPDNMDVVGKGDQKETDDRGHLIADTLNGSSSMENLVPMDAGLNRGDYKSMENKLREAVDSGSDVYIKAEPKYKGESHRPDRVRITYTIDGVKTVQTFMNGSDNIK